MSERYELINREEGSYPISLMCRWSRVSKSGYYSWRDRPQSQTAIRREELAILIKDVFEDSDGTYGYRRIQVILERRGVRADGATIRAIMRDLGLQAAQPRAKVRTTVPAQDLGERPDLLRRDFTADEPGKKLCGDITYVRTWAGFIYLATVLDCCTKKVVGSSPTGGTNKWTAGCFSDSACFVFQAAFVKSRKSRSTSFGVRYPRAE